MKRKISGSKTWGLLLAASAATPFFSCQHVERAPSSEKPPAPSWEGAAAVEDLGQRVRSLTAENCESLLPEAARSIERVSLHDMTPARLRAEGRDLPGRLWQTRKELHLKLSSFPEVCARMSHSLFREIRYLEDFLSEVIADSPDQDPAQLNFQEQATPLRQQRQYYELVGDPTLQDGDLLVTRGISFLSANIGQISDADSQFSHIVFYHQEPSGSEHTIESYVGAGVQTFAIDFALKNENARILVLRSRDAALAHRASQSMWKKVTAAAQAGRPYEYDFDFLWDDHSKMSCAEVARAAYDEASSGAIVIPRYPSAIDFENTAFLKRIRMKNGMTFSPGDLEIDPRFELVAEWKDLRLTRDSRRKDVILQSMFQWMNERNYVLVDSAESKVAGKIIWPASRTVFWPLLRRLSGAPESTPKIPRKLFQTMALLNQLGEALLGKLAALDEEHEKQTGWPMTVSQLTQTLDEMREADWLIYQSGASGRKASVFHRYFRPASR